METSETADPVMVVFRGRTQDSGSHLPVVGFLLQKCIKSETGNRSVELRFFLVTELNHAHTHTRTHTHMHTHTHAHTHTHTQHTHMHTHTHTRTHATHTHMHTHTHTHTHQSDKGMDVLRVHRAFGQSKEKVRSLLKLCLVVCKACSISQQHRQIFWACYV